MTNLFIKLKLRLISPYIIVFLIFLIPRIINLGSDISNYDASFWYPRMDDFTKDLIKGDLQGTYQQYHPGVTLLYISGSFKYIFERIFDLVYGYNPRFLPQQFVKLQFFTLLPLELLFSLLAVLWFYLLKKIIDVKFTIIFVTILSLEPFFLGVTKFVHVTALSSIFSFSGFLCLYYYLYLSKSIKYYYLSAFFLGLGVLSKVDSFIMVFLCSLFILSVLRNNKIKAINTTINYLIVISLTVFLLFPALWVSPFYMINKIYNEGISDNAFASNGEVTVLNIPYGYYIEMLFYRTSPVIITGFIMFFVLFKKLNKKSNNILNVSLYFVITMIAILSIPKKENDRYLIYFYPLLILVATSFYYYISTLKSRLIKSMSLVLILIYYIVVIYEYHPVYSYYHSELIGGAINLQNHGMKVKNRGEYYAQAAFYLNNRDKQKAFDKYVVLDHREQIRTFAPFYYGKTLTNPSFLPDGKNADYMIFREDYEYLIPKDCTFLNSFGPKGVVYQEVLKVFQCKNIYNKYEFKN